MADEILTEVPDISHHKTQADEILRQANQPGADLDELKTRMDRVIAEVDEIDKNIQKKSFAGNLGRLLTHYNDSRDYVHEAQENFNRIYEERPKKIEAG